MRQLTLILAALVLALQIVKGLSVETSLYPLLSYIFTYADGPVRRGLFPTLFSAVGITDLKEIGRTLTNAHIILLAALAGALLGRLSQLPYPGDRARRLLLWLLLGSAVLPVLSATTGYIDVLLALTLLMIAALLAEGYAAVAAAILFVLCLQHEMVLLPGLCLFAAEALLVPTHRKPIWLAALGLVIASVSYLAFTAAYQTELIPLAQARCAELRPAAHALVKEVWDPYCVRQARATLASDFTPLRLILLPAFLMVYGALPIALLVAVLMQWRTGSSTRFTAAFLAISAVPYGLIMIAWDTDRFIILASFTGWLIMDRWLQCRPHLKVSRGVGVGVAALVAAQLMLSYPAVDVYGQRRAISPQLTRDYLVDPRQWVLPILAHYQLVTPPFLDPKTCIDLRCS